MPYELQQASGGRWCVVKQADGRRMGCHATRAEALAQLRALYAAESGKALRPRWEDVVDPGDAWKYHRGTRHAPPPKSQPAPPKKWPPLTGPPQNVNLQQPIGTIGGRPYTPPAQAKPPPKPVPKPPPKPAKPPTSTTKQPTSTTPPPTLPQLAQQPSPAQNLAGFPPGAEWTLAIGTGPTGSVPDPGPWPFIWGPALGTGGTYPVRETPPWYVPRFGKPWWSKKKLITILHELGIVPKKGPGSTRIPPLFPNPPKPPSKKAIKAVLLDAFHEAWRTGYGDAMRGSF